MTDIYIVSGVRTAIGTFGGALKDTFWEQDRLDFVKRRLGLS